MNWMPNFRAISIFLLLILAFTQVAAKVSLKPLPAEQFSSITSAKKHPLSSHYNNLPANFQKLISMKGGESNNSNEVTKPSFLSNWKKNLLGIWGVVQVVSILGNALKRLIPIALQPIQQNNLTPIHWAMYVAFCGIMAYSEGYKAFHLKFSPLVVSRSFDLVNNPSFLNYILAGPYSMGMFNASRKRMIVSWGITIGVFALVKVVKFLPYPYRSIVDAGAVCGLGLGTLSIVFLTVKALFGGKVEAPEAGWMGLVTSGPVCTSKAYIFAHINIS